MWTLFNVHFSAAKVLLLLLLFLLLCFTLFVAVTLKLLYLSPSLSELKAVLQRSPIRFRGNRGDLPTCAEDPAGRGKAQRAQEGERGVL